ncbi:MAG TPA: prepilin-type N-terminal cleavage/methylation domain-containing protein [Candidatus Saccharimonadales bacterium]|nr:prepilin-type N-terminal cleavage/methylation domain-containing protein [Candidatus Saccharimonadales bacterium]
MIQKLRNRDEGFTIIEVLIVLAIAGLILLIIFLAVPALQRSSRNTQRKNDAAAVAGAVANYISNNGGTLVIAGGTKTDTDPNAVDVCAVAACASGNFESAKLGYYTPANVSIIASSKPAGTLPTTNTIVVDPGYNCNSSNTDVGVATTRTAAVLYQIETGSGSSAMQCVEQ